MKLQGRNAWYLGLAGLAWLLATPALAEPAKKPTPAAKVAAVKKPAHAAKTTKHAAKTKHATKKAAPAKHAAVVVHDVPLPHQRPVVAKRPEPPVAANDIPLPHQRPIVAKMPEHPVVAYDVPLPRQRPLAAGKPVIVPVPPVRASLALPGLSFPPIPQVRPSAAMIPFAVAPTISTSAADVAALKRVLEATRKGKSADADAAEAAIADPLARKVAEWAILRVEGANAGFRRYVAFMVANPSWSHITLFRKRAESQLWSDQADDATVLAFFAKQQPITAKGRYTLARVLLAKGDRAGAAELVRQAWRNQECSDEIEAKVLGTFGGLLTPADHRARMDRRFYEEDTEAALRAAKRLGAHDQAVARAWVAVIRRAKNAKALLDSVPTEARAEAGYIFARVRWLRQNDKAEEAARLILTAPREPQAYGPDAWWQERRLLVRALLDRHDAKTAYRIAAEGMLPERLFYRSDRYFTAGWVALRYLNDPKAAMAQFANIGEVSDSPHALARAGYWQGRAAEAMGDAAKAKHFYELAARQTLTYYGQLARARLGLTELGLRGPPLVTPQERNALRHLEIVRAVELLYTLDERDLVASMFAEMGENGSDVAGMTGMADVAAQHNDGRAMVLLGEAAYGRNLPFDYAAYPTVGLPDYRPIAPPIEPAIAYSIARQESKFNQKDVSPAKAMGLMQVTPEAAIDTAKRFKAVYNRGRLLSDAVYNMQMGAGELSNLLAGYNGSYILTFAGYNAGRGRVRQWIAAYGDPRDPSVDPVDWVERIPISETRNYVMRVMENLQVYRARFGGGSKLVIEADLRRGATN